MDPVVDLHIEAFVRDEQSILTDIRWRVMPDENWVVLGANGAGKTSLLNIVAGYEWPSRGNVAVLGHRYGSCDMRALKERIGWVSSSLYTWLPDRQRAREVVATGLYATIGNWRTATDGDLARADAALQRIGADRCANKPYGVLSQGEKQRVMIARALVTDPSLLILDEPCAGLDPGAREHLLRDVDRLCGPTRGPTLILVSHHVEEIPPCATHALLLKDGRAVGAGPLSEVLRRELVSTVYDFPCDVALVNGRYWLRV